MTISENSSYEIFKTIVDITQMTYLCMHELDLKYLVLGLHYVASCMTVGGCLTFPLVAMVGSFLLLWDLQKEWEGGKNIKQVLVWA